MWPVRTNAGFLARAAADPDFVAGHVDTGFIEHHAARLVPDAEPTPEIVDAAAAALIPARGTDPWIALQGFRLNGRPDLRVAVEIAGRIQVGQARPCGAAAVVGEATVLFLDGVAWPFRRPMATQANREGVSDGAILAPMPGQIVAVEVSAGDAVKRGQKLVVLEAMKMEQALQAPFDGVVAILNATAGARVREGDVLVRIERAD